jgi:hypothetical protein
MRIASLRNVRKTMPLVIKGKFAFAEKRQKEEYVIPECCYRESRAKSSQCKI